MTDSPQASKQTETDSLTTLESSYGQANAQAVQFGQEHAARQNHITMLYQQMAVTGTNNMAAIAAAEDNALGLLRAFCEHLGKWQAHFLSYEPLARTLGAAGLPRLSVRVHEITSDVAVALETYRAICDSMVQQRQRMLRIANDTASQINRIVQEAVAAQKRTFDAYQTRWSNEAFNKCPVCGSLLESRTFPHCWKCRATVIRF